MPMTLTEYWDALEQDVSNLRQLFGQTFDYQHYAPATAALNMATAGKQIEQASGFTWLTQLRTIQRDIKRHELDIGDPLPDQDICQPRLTDHRDFFFAIIYFYHQIRFADVQTASAMINLGVQPLKPQVALNATGLGRLINQYYEQHQPAIDEQFPQIIAAAGGSIIDKVASLLRAQALIAEPGQEQTTPGAAPAPGLSFEDIMALAIQQEFEHIIEQGTNARSIVTQLRNHFNDKEQTITRMYHALRLLNQLNQENTGLANLDNTCLTNFMNQIPEGDRREWERKIETALMPPAARVSNSPVIEPEAPATNLRQKTASLISGLWSFGKWAVEGTGEFIKPWSPDLVTSVTQSIYHVSTNLTERAATGVAYLAGALPNAPQAQPDVAAAQTKRELSTFVSTYYDAVAHNLITPDSALTLADARRARPEELLRLKEKLGILNTVLVLDRHMEDFINTHNRGLVKFIDFFRPINLFLSRTFFRYVLHDKALLLEEARQLKQSLGAIKQQLEQEHEPENIKEHLLECSSTTRRSVTRVSQTSRYVFLNQAHKEDAQLAATEFAERIAQATAPITSPAA